ncbi:unnamed protein product [Caenorhabditis bovis]|uniref:Uncharacterized protein n=1 Tax=Caenorhabditis bovis TaxID=2654633 RepID=A0A8S1F4D8_9PELO|nr:unnamed protein product [Caenorhabditis bovis]
MRYLRPDDEIANNHFHLELSKHTYYFFVFWTIWILGIIITGWFNTFSSPIVPWDNCDRALDRPSIRFINEKQFENEVRKLNRFREIIRMHLNDNMTRIDYGLSQLTFCKVRSIVRTNELDPYVSAGLRFVILQTMVFRMVIAIIHTSDLLLSRSPLPKVIQWILSLSPYIQCLQSASAFWVVSFHSEFDRLIGKWHPYAFLSLGFFTLLDMFIDLIHDAVDTRMKLLKSPKFWLKCAFFAGFIFAYPHIVMHWLEFFRDKRCHSYVSWQNAFLEYLCVTSILIFQFCQSVMPLKMWIAPTLDDCQNVSSFPVHIYSPVYHMKVKEYEYISSAI